MSKEHSTEVDNKIESKQIDKQDSSQIAGQSEDILFDNSKKISSSNERETIRDILEEDLEDKDIFINLAKNPKYYTTIKSFLDANQDNAQWKIVKNILVINNTLQEDKVRLAASIIKSEDVPIFPSQSQSTSYINSSPSPLYNSQTDSDYEPNESDQMSNSKDTPPHETANNDDKANTRSNYKIKDKKIRGKVITYAKDIMGGFSFEARNGKTYINKESVIERPIEVTGNLGSKTAGDHLISLAFYTKYFNSLVRGEELYAAIDIFRVKVASLHEATDQTNKQDSYCRSPKHLTPLA